MEKERCQVHLYAASEVTVLGRLEWWQQSKLFYFISVVPFNFFWTPDNDDHYFRGVHFVIPMAIFPMGKSGRFAQGKPAATESRYPNAYSNYKVHAGSVRVSIIHRTLTWTTGSLTCVRDHSYACVYIQGGWAHPQRVSTTFLTRRNSHKFFLCSWRGSNSGLWSSSPTLYQLSHPVTTAYVPENQLNRNVSTELSVTRTSEDMYHSRLPQRLPSKKNTTREWRGVIWNQFVSLVGKT